MQTGWRVTLVGFAINVLVGITYTWSLFARGLVVQHGWTQAQAAAPYTAFLFFYAFSMIPAGRMQDRLGPRPIISAGAVFGGAAFALCAVFLTPLGVTILWGGLLGLGMACCFAAVTPAAVKWFPPERKGLVAGIVVTGIGVSAFVLSPWIQRWVDRSVSYAFVVSGAILFVGVFALAQFVKNPPGAPSAHAARHGRVSVFRSTRFYLFWLMFFFTTSAGVTVVSHLDSLTRVHTGYERGYLIISVFALFNAAGRIAVGFVSDRIGRERTMTLVFSTILVSLGGLFVSATPAVLGLSVAILGLSYGGLYSIFPAATATFFGEEGFGLNYGLVFSALGAAGVLPLIAGALFERYGTFHPALIVLAVMCAAAIGLSFILRRGHAAPVHGAA